MRVASPFGNLTINTFEKGEHVDNIAVEKEFNREALGEKKTFVFFILFSICEHGHHLNSYLYIIRIVLYSL